MPQFFPCGSHEQQVMLRAVLYGSTERLSVRLWPPRDPASSKDWGCPTIPPFLLASLPVLVQDSLARYPSARVLCCHREKNVGRQGEKCHLARNYFHQKAETPRRLDRNV